ncbi:ABC transporter permease [Salipaludibacillus sp. HK11]|uniref:ABC transporter permease n=1 Tax=Salipaludibacillus sp. HK11 TaxID=3394320 RepID=UPI0039FCA083
MNVNHVMAIFEKDLKEFMRNMMLLTLPFIPPFIALMYSRIDMGGEGLPLSMIYIIVGTTFASVTAGGMMTSMAEENEKKTLRGLGQSPATFIDIIAGKSLVFLIMTVTSLLASYLILSIEGFFSVKVVIGLILSCFFFLMLGISIGILSKSIAATSAYIMPILFLFGFTPMIEMAIQSPDHLARQIASYFPIYQNVALHEEAFQLQPFIVLVAWLLIAGIVAYLAFNKKLKDD